MRPFKTNAILYLLSLLFLPVLSSPMLAQDSKSSEQKPGDQVYQSSEVLKANTRLVLIDVVATDGKGVPVTDLRREDFALLEDGSKQTVSSFSFQHPGNGNTVQAKALPAGVVTNSPQYKSSSLNVMLIDTLNGDFGEQAFVKDQLLKYFSNAQPDRPIAIFALQERLLLLHDFSTDAAELRKSVEHFTPPARFNNAETTASRASAFTTFGDYHTSERSIQMTLNNLNALAKVLAGYSGRKNLIWLSESFPINLFPEITNRGAAGVCNGDACNSGNSAIGRGAMEGTGSGSYMDFAAQIKRVSDALMAAQVAVYAVDASAVGKNEHSAAEHTMNDMAAATGGRAFHNTNDLVASIRTSIDDGATYYTLAYYPDNHKWEGQFRSIQVKAAREGINLRYRAGYYALDQQQLRKNESEKLAEDFSRSMQLDSPAATSIRFQAAVIPPAEKKSKVLVNFAIDPHTLAFERGGDGVEHAKVSCTVWAYSHDKDKPSMSNGDTVVANLKPEVYQEMLKQYFPCKRELDLKPGTYTLRLGVLDRTSSQIGTTSTTVTIE
jgi:VWFA-related protein